MIFKDIISSVYDPKYYMRIAQEKSGSAFAFLAKLSLLVAFVFALVFSIVNMQNVFQVVNVGISSLTDKYPSELEVVIKDGQVSTNVSEPYIIPLPTDGKTLNKNIPKNLIVFDTKTPLTLDKIKLYDSMLLVSKDKVVVYQKNNGKTEIKDVPKFPEPFTLNKGVIQNFVGQWLPVLKILIWFIPILLFIIMFVGKFIGTMFIALLGAFCVWIIMAIKKIDSSYGTSYRISLHLFTGLTLINLVLGFVAPTLSLGFMISTIIFIGCAILNLKKEEKRIAEVV